MKPFQIIAAAVIYLFIGGLVSKPICKSVDNIRPGRRESAEVFTTAIWPLVLPVWCGYHVWELRVNVTPQKGASDDSEK